MAQTFYADLSFTRRADPESELTLWSVSPTGKYARDCHAGSLYAFEALEFLVNDPTDMGYLLSGVALAMIRTVGEPSGIEVGFWGTIQKFAIAGVNAGVKVHHWPE